MLVPPFISCSVVGLDGYIVMLKSISTLVLEFPLLRLLVLPDTA